MARTKLMQLVLFGAGGVLLYRAALNGSLGTGAQQFIVGLRTGGTGISPVVPVAPAAPVTPPPVSGGSPGAVFNPNYSQQERAWQLERCFNGEDALDWQAFRAHLHGIGAPDPGSVPTTSFMTFRCLNGIPL